MAVSDDGGETYRKVSAAQSWSDHIDPYLTASLQDWGSRDLAVGLSAVIADSHTDIEVKGTVIPRLHPE